MAHPPAEHRTKMASAPRVVISQPPVPALAFQRFAGRWVALKRGRVVADAESLKKLEADARVGRSDTRFLVPKKDSKFF